MKLFGQSIGVYADASERCSFFTPEVVFSGAPRRNLAIAFGHVTRDTKFAWTATLVECRHTLYRLEGGSEGNLFGLKRFYYLLCPNSLL